MQASLILTLEPGGDRPIPLLRVVNGALVRAVVAHALADAARIVETFADDELLSIAARSELETLRTVLMMIDGGATAGAVVN